MSCHRAVPLQTLTSGAPEVSPAAATMSAMSCVPLDPFVQRVLDHLARSVEPHTIRTIAESVGGSESHVDEAVDYLVANGWVFGRDGSWRVSGAGYSHSSDRRLGGILGDC